MEASKEQFLRKLEAREGGYGILNSVGYSLSGARRLDAEFGTSYEKKLGDLIDGLEDFLKSLVINEV